MMSLKHVDEAVAQEIVFHSTRPLSQRDAAFLRMNEHLNPVDWTYLVAFKAPKSTKITWVDSGVKDVSRASQVTRAFIDRTYPGKKLHEYGHSKQHWIVYPRGQKGAITREDYDRIRAKRGEV